MNQLGVEHFYIELVEDCPCDRNEELLKREGEIIRSIGTLNKCGMVNIKETLNNIQQYGINETRNISRNIMNKARNIYQYSTKDITNITRNIL